MLFVSGARVLGGDSPNMVPDIKPPGPEVGLGAAASGAVLSLIRVDRRGNWGGAAGAATGGEEEEE